jgi:hypothetical protein
MSMPMTLATIVCSSGFDPTFTLPISRRAPSMSPVMSVLNASRY